MGDKMIFTYPCLVIDISEDIIEFKQPVFVNTLDQQLSDSEVGILIPTFLKEKCKCIDTIVVNFAVQMVLQVHN